MNNFKEKSQVFIVGVMAGLIIAGGFFILKLDDYFKELNLYKRVSTTFSVEHKKKESTKDDNDLIKNEEKIINTPKIKNKKVAAVDTLRKTNYTISADTLKRKLSKDSTVTDFNKQDEIVVRKDELLFTKTFDIINLHPITKTTNYKDSLLHKVSGVDEDKINTKQLLNAEFWQSPLHYKGYKMSKYKLVLYGINSFDGVKIVKLDDVIYLKNVGIVYKLDYSSDFKSYERITDETIINKLK